MIDLRSRRRHARGRCFHVASDRERCIAPPPSYRPASASRTSPAANFILKVDYQETPRITFREPRWRIGGGATNRRDRAAPDKTGTASAFPPTTLRHPQRRGYVARKVSKRRGQSRKAGSNAEDIRWPGTDESVALVHALIAIAFGNAPILARYLRETRPIYSGVTDLIAFMLDPAGHPQETGRRAGRTDAVNSGGAVAFTVSAPDCG
jgi:hypothetical protein